MIVVDQLVKSFRDLRRGEVHAVDHVSFRAGPGEILGLLGPNGAGKTTTMRILCTVLKPTGGSATLAGFDVATQPSQVRQNIGFLSANTALYDRMTAWELVDFFGRLYGLSDERLKQRMEAVFTALQMNDFRDMLGAKMSTGMRQKVSIARAIIHDPPIMIFDEATLGLDVLVARAVLNTVEELKAQGKCILFSTHIMREVEKLCDRVAIIAKGRIQAIGALDELREKHGEQDMEELFFRLVS
ncbi:MAG: ATP-binding cassette domain-containing protein [Planctomycetota bacterium]